MFEIIPCVDIQQGRAVRLFEGDPEQETVYFDKPLEAARHWAEGGCQWLHFVDLDAALGKGNNRKIIAQARDAVACRIEVGGGIRDLESARDLLKVVDRIILGTVAISRPELIEQLLAEVDAERVAVSIDAKDGMVAIKGWQELSAISAVDLAARVEEQGIKHLIYTDISRDGTLRGINPEPVKAMRAAYPHSLIGGGGVASDADLELYEALGLQGAIVGRALYEGRISYPRTA